MLIANHYSIIAHEGNTFRVRLCPECRVYEGHFPGAPISPGVANIQMIRELAEEMVGRPIRLTTIRQCRMTGLITPTDTPELTISIDLTDDNLVATILHQQQSLLTLKANIE